MSMPLQAAEKEGTKTLQEMPKQPGNKRARIVKVGAAGGGRRKQ